MDSKQKAILYSCYYKEKFEKEQLADEHALTFVQSGTIQFTTPDGIKVFKGGEIIFIRRNQLLKSEKIPDLYGNPVKSVTIFLTQEALRAYAVETNTAQQPLYSGNKILRLSPNVFLEAFFQSLIPYYDTPEALNEPITVLKTREAIELLLQTGNFAKSLLFDFSEPFKIDLEAFMLQNFEYNVSLKEFARLSGRSISTFKRDFQKLFNSTPEKWIREQRLEKAHYLIKEKKQKPSDIYLKVGFENLSHFTTAFKDYFGVTPSSV